MNRRTHTQYLEYYSVWTLSLIKLVLIFDNASFFDPGFYASRLRSPGENSAFKFYFGLNSSMHIILCDKAKLLVAIKRRSDSVIFSKFVFLISLGMETPC